MQNPWKDKLPEMKPNAPANLRELFNILFARVNCLFNVSFGPGFDVTKRRDGWVVSLSHHQNHGRIVRTLEEIPAKTGGVAGSGDATLLKMLEDGTIEDTGVTVKVYNFMSSGPVPDDTECLVKRLENGRLVIDMEDNVCA